MGPCCIEKEMRLTQEEFTAVLIDKLNQVKRDREIRETLQDALREFRECEPWLMEAKHLEPKCNYTSTRESIYTDQWRTRAKNAANNKKVEGRRFTTTRSSRPHFHGYRDACCVANHEAANSRRKQIRKGENSMRNSNTNSLIIVGYCISGNPVPYSTKVRGKNITLGQFKTLLNRKGCYRYFFKKYSNEFGTNIVFEEVSDDEDIVPLWEGKVFALVEDIEEFIL